ncbi:P-loop containing nucleoside triphosphate hydrolase protein [Punctularia strigosozonata HHB-11173 SS5]|uniref:P-loop containing nucleoside triphosphate hydrolase protein n=1 Tax=Punctularia strigosozonata (strain HHB-11173) TaxID=741275 RepID=UPI000441667A|nr:P-loop containing nucleoside triphosphate hydrolase protein [Punctularia strigosozonata HHB-11173 SS5]EIN11416.1 P-loop containing nucleoside triphosphate hydrolase protein [Punctularia strigosozonata HHB-11173 SS5]
MATLRSFQQDIDDIHNREVAKQRAQATAAQVQITKDSKKPRIEKEKPRTEKEKAGVKSDDSTADAWGKKAEGFDLQSGVEEEIVTLLTSGVPTNHDRAKDMLSALLTQHRGEYVFRLGAQPPHARLFAGESLNGDDWTGVARTPDELARLRAAIVTATEEVGGKVSILFESGDGPRITLLLRLPPPNVSLTPEVRCAVVGNVDSGKSTTLGVLTRGALDDGRGRARVALFRHKHEVETGRTSSVGMEILGFAPSGAPILPNSGAPLDPETIKHEKLSWDAIAEQAAKIVSFIDLAGHERYLKTTLYGLTSGAPSCVMLIVGANAGLIGMSKEHLAISLALNVPVVVCITKIDMTPPKILAETVERVVKILKSPGCRKTPVFVKNMETAVEVSQTFAKERLCPIFQVSNVTGAGLDYVRTFLNLLPSSEGDDEKFVAEQPLEYSITEVWSVPYVGTVVNGIINSGVIKTGDNVWYGPDANGNWQSTAIKSMQRKRATVTSAEAGQSVSCALKRVRKAAVRKGMVLVHKGETPPKAVREFEGQVLILYHNTTMQKNYQAMLHCGAVRQTVRIVSINHPGGLLRTGDRATVTFQFISHPEFVKEGMKLLFREGKTKGLGVITRIL